MAPPTCRHVSATRGDSQGLLGARGEKCQCTSEDMPVATHSGCRAPVICGDAWPAAGIAATSTGPQCTSEDMPVATHACCRAPVICSDAWPAAGRWRRPLCRHVSATRGRISGTAGGRPRGHHLWLLTECHSAPAGAKSALWVSWMLRSRRLHGQADCNAAEPAIGIVHAAGQSVSRIDRSTDHLISETGWIGGISCLV